MKEVRIESIKQSLDAFSQNRCVTTIILNDFVHQSFKSFGFIRCWKMRFDHLLFRKDNSLIAHLLRIRLIEMQLESVIELHLIEINICSLIPLLQANLHTHTHTRAHTHLTNTWVLDIYQRENGQYCTSYLSSSFLSVRLYIHIFAWLLAVIHNIYRRKTGYANDVSTLMNDTLMKQEKKRRDDVGKLRTTVLRRNNQANLAFLLLLFESSRSSQKTVDRRAHFSTHHLPFHILSSLLLLLLVTKENSPSERTAGHSMMLCHTAAMKWLLLLFSLSCSFSRESKEENI